MMAATTCSCTSAPWNGRDLERCVKVRRSPTRSWRIVALASRRPTTCAPPTDDFRGFASRNQSKDQEAADYRGLFYFVATKCVPVFCCNQALTGIFAATKRLPAERSGQRTEVVRRKIL